jgi:hypothetical protein
VVLLPEAFAVAAVVAVVIMVAVVVVAVLLLTLVFQPAAVAARHSLSPRPPMLRTSRVCAPATGR